MLALELLGVVPQHLLPKAKAEPRTFTSHSLILVGKRGYFITSTLYCTSSIKQHPELLLQFYNYNSNYYSYVITNSLLCNYVQVLRW